MRWVLFSQYFTVVRVQYEFIIIIMCEWVDKQISIVVPRAREDERVRDVQLNRVARLTGPSINKFTVLWRAWTMASSLYRIKSHSINVSSLQHTLTATFVPSLVKMHIKLLLTNNIQGTDGGEANKYVRISSYKKFKSLKPHKHSRPTFRPLTHDDERTKEERWLPTRISITLFDEVEVVDWDWKAAAEPARKYENEKMTSEWNTIWSSQSKREGKTTTTNEQSLKSDLRILEEFHESFFSPLISFNISFQLAALLPLRRRRRSARHHTSSSSVVYSSSSPFFCLLDVYIILNIFEKCWKKFCTRKKNNISRFHFFLSLLCVYF